MDENSVDTDQLASYVSTLFSIEGRESLMIYIFKVLYGVQW